jgi:hypothetical protein
MTESRFTEEHNGIESNKRHLKIPKKGHFVTMNFLFIPFVTSWMESPCLGVPLTLDGTQLKSLGVLQSNLLGTSSTGPKSQALNLYK